MEAVIMKFEDWWENLDKDFSKNAIPDEIKWFTRQAWKAAIDNRNSINNTYTQCNCGTSAYRESSGGCPIHGASEFPR